MAPSRLTETVPKQRSLGLFNVDGCRPARVEAHLSLAQPLHVVYRRPAGRVVLPGLLHDIPGIRTPCEPHRIPVVQHPAWMDPWLGDGNPGVYPVAIIRLAVPAYARPAFACSDAHTVEYCIHDVHREFPRQMVWNTVIHSGGGLLLHTCLTLPDSSDPMR